MPKFSLLFVLFSLSCFFLAAEDSLNLTVDGAVQLGLSRNLDFENDRIDLASARDSAQNRWNTFLPTLSADSSLYESDTLASDEWTSEFLDSVELALSASLSVDVSDLSEPKLTELERENQELTFQDAQNALERDIKKQFYYLLAIRENLTMQEKNIDLAQKQYDQTLLNFRSGLVSELSLLQAQTSLAELKPDYQDTYTDYQTQMMSFKKLLGLDLSREISLEGELEVERYQWEADTLLDAFLGNNLTIRGERNSLEQADLSEKMTRQENRLPSLSLSSEWAHDYDLTGGDPFWEDALTVSVGLSLPLDGFISGSSSAVEDRDADRTREQQENSLSDTIQSEEETVRTLLLELEGNWTNIETMEQSVELAEKTYEMTKISYEKGNSEFLDVEDALNNYLEAGQNLLLSRYDYLSGILDLEYTLNTTIDQLKEMGN
ncbi:MAG: TolC family protein [Spirochaetales bacterium]|nr:TolC family protein [Spirochaetales bacterium]